MLVISLGNCIPVTSSYGFAHGVGFQDVITGTNTSLDLIGARLRGDGLDEREITNSSCVRIMPWGVLSCL